MFLLTDHLGHWQRRWYVFSATSESWVRQHKLSFLKNQVIYDGCGIVCWWLYDPDEIYGKWNVTWLRFPTSSRPGTWKIPKKAKSHIIYSMDGLIIPTVSARSVHIPQPSGPRTSSCWPTALGGLTKKPPCEHQQGIPTCPLRHTKISDR